jgi:DNA-binding MarR family transcriptional regulator
MAASLAVVSVRFSYVVGRLDRVLRRRLGAALAPHGLTVAEYTALSVLRTRSGLSNAQLARRTLITPQAMNEVLARLVDRGYVRRTADPDHGRIIRTELTEAADRVLDACDRDVDQIERAMLRGVPAGERARLKDVLAGCVERLGGGLGHRD